MRQIISISTVGGLVLGLALGLVLGKGGVVFQSSSYVIPAGTPTHIQRAIDSSVRSKEHSDRDATRKPAEILTLAGIEEGDEVIEFASAGHYYSTLLTEAVGPRGHVYLIDMPYTEPFVGPEARAFVAEHANATFTPGHFNRTDLPGGVDAAMMVLYYHDLQTQTGDQRVDTLDMNARILQALRPGGTFIIVDHKAEDFTGWRDAVTLHRVDEVTIIQEVTSAGFEIVASSNILANPDDDHSLDMRDASIRGNTDRAVLVFRKPGG